MYDEEISTWVCSGFTTLVANLIGLIVLIGPGLIGSGPKVGRLAPFPLKVSPKLFDRAEPEFTTPVANLIASCP